MATNTTTVDLTVPFLIWAGVWTVIAFATGNLWLLWVAAGPILAWWFLVGVLMFAGILVMFFAYLGGERIKFTNYKGEVRYYQRGKR